MIPTPVAVDEQLPEPEVACSLLCRVCRRASRPTSDSEIHHEVWMPASGWNGKLVVVGNVLSQQSAKVTLVEDDGVIEQFATHASDPALCDTVLPRASEGRPRWA